MLNKSEHENDDKRLQKQMPHDNSVYVQSKEENINAERAEKILMNCPAPWNERELRVIEEVL